jgi:hypothetical protein
MKNKNKSKEEIQIKKRRIKIVVHSTFCMFVAKGNNEKTRAEYEREREEDKFPQAQCDIISIQKAFLSTVPHVCLHVNCTIL